MVRWLGLVTGGLLGLPVSVAGNTEVSCEIRHGSLEDPDEKKQCMVLRPFLSRWKVDEKPEPQFLSVGLRLNNFCRDECLEGMFN